jgi:hypothetical protein
VAKTYSYSVRVEALLLREDLGPSLPRGWKKRATELCRAILTETPDGTPVTDEPVALFLAALLSRHPCAGEKTGCGIAFFTTATERVYQTRHFVIVRTDGSFTDFSFTACITAPSHKDECRKAMRAAVADQVAGFRRHCFTRDPAQACAKCGALLSRKAEVDHAGPSFDQLASDYAAAVGGWEKVTLEPSAEGETGRRLSPGDAYTWGLFHQRYASLRLLCAPCNRKRG